MENSEARKNQQKTTTEDAKEVQPDEAGRIHARSRLIPNDIVQITSPNNAKKPYFLQNQEKICSSSYASSVLIQERDHVSEG